MLSTRSRPLCSWRRRFLARDSARHVLAGSSGQLDRLGNELGHGRSRSLGARLPVFSAETIRGKEAEFIRERLPRKAPRARFGVRVALLRRTRLVAHALAGGGEADQDGSTSTRAVACVAESTTRRSPRSGSCSTSSTRARQSIDYEAAVEEALCFGWIDSLVRRLDAQRYARKFTPRKPDSRWSDVSRRYASLEKRGCSWTPAAPMRRPASALTRFGSAAQWMRGARLLERALKAERARLGFFGGARGVVSAALRRWIERSFKDDPAAWRFFEALAPSYRRAYVGWIDAAKREETRERRLHEAVGSACEGREAGAQIGV